MLTAGWTGVRDELQNFQFPPGDGLGGGTHPVHQAVRDRGRAATLVTPEHGQVLIEGVDTAPLSRAGKAALRRERVGIVFQQPNLLPVLTAAEQLQVMAHLSGRSPARTRDRVRELPAAVGLTGQAGRRTSCPEVSASG